MKKNLIAVLPLLLIPGLLYAQAPVTDSTAKTQIAKLGFIEGIWKGKGWMMAGGGQKHYFDQTERVQFKLNNTMLMIEGNGKENGKDIHTALALVTWNKKDSLFSFKSWLATGQAGEFKGEFKDGKFYWYPNANMQYIIELNGKGQWFETGEMKRNGSWVKFFEMTLDKTGKVE